MAQVLEVNVSRTEKNGCFYKKTILYQNSVFGEIQFSQKYLINRKKTTNPSTTSPCETNPNNILFLLQAPKVRNCREAAVLEIETEIQKLLEFEKKLPTIHTRNSKSTFYLA